MAEAEKPKRAMPKRKGGTRFPRYTLSEALPWAKKLVSKTHAGPQSKEVVASGVVDSKGSTAEIRISALKQFGLLDGPATAYAATDLAKNITNAPEGETGSLYAVAALTPPVFKELYNTFQSDGVSKGKLKQRAAGLGVHPDETEKCVDIYVATMLLAKLVEVDGETVTHALLPRDGNSASQFGAVAESDDIAANEVEDNPRDEANDDQGIVSPQRRGSATVNVTITLDSSLDTEKLERQLKLLRRFGAL